MSLALPDGFVDCGVVRTVTNAGSLRLRMDSDPGIYAGFGEGAQRWKITDQSVVGGCFVGGDPLRPGGVGIYQLALDGPFAGTPILLEGPTVFACTEGWQKWSATYGYTLTAGPFRLGARRGSIETSPYPVPEFWDNSFIEYLWFADENTTFVSTFAGQTTGTLHYQPGGGSGAWGTGTHAGMTPEAYPLPRLWFFFGNDGGGSSEGAEAIMAEFTGLSADGQQVDTIDLRSLFMRGVGGGNVDCIVLDVVEEDGNGVDPPYRFSYDLDVTKFGGASTGAHVLDQFIVPKQFHSDGSQKQPQADYLAMPYGASSPASFIVENPSWETHKKRLMAPFYFDIDPGWAATVQPPANLALETDDLQVPIYGSPGARDPSTISPYTPVKLHVIASIDLLRPDGNTPSVFVTDDAAKLTVTEGGTSTTFHVSAAGGSATRTLHNWRLRAAPSSAADYEETKHRAASSEDVWDWSTYAWQLQAWAAPAASSARMTVRGVYYEVEDDHNAPPSIATSETPFVLNFTVDLPAGSSTQHVRIDFPDEGGPQYLGRVDSVQLTFAAAGDFALTKWQLEAREDGYLKIDFGPPVVRKDYSCLGVAQDGAFVLGNWPDQAYKPDETGDYGGGLRHVTPLTVLGDIADFTRSLQDAWTNLHLVEGLVAVYTLADSDAAMQDAYGTRMTPETAQDLESLAPYGRLSPGADYSPPVTPRVRRLAITNGHSFAVKVRWPIWGALEAQAATDGGAPAPSGVACAAQRLDTGERQGTGTTDPSGFVVVTPVPANGSVEWKLVAL